MHIKPIIELPSSFVQFEQESKLQGFNFLEKMNLDWESGKNRFNKNREILLAAYNANELIGVGGVNIDQPKSGFRPGYASLSRAR